MSKPDDESLPNPGPYESAPEGESEAKSKSGCGCFFYGCLFSFLFLVVLVVGGGFAGYWWFQGQVNKWTEETAANLPVVEFTDEKVEEIENRVETFQEAVDEGETPEPLVLTAEEINALISSDDDLKGRVYVRIEDGKITGDVSIPTDVLPGGKGRFFNASATFNASLDNGVLIVTLADAEVKGEKVPDEIIEAMGRENLAKDVYKDPEVAETLRRFESLKIEDDKIVLTPRPVSAGGDSPTKEAPDDASGSDAAEDGTAADSSHAIDGDKAGEDALKAPAPAGGDESSQETSASEEPATTAADSDSGASDSEDSGSAVSGDGKEAAAAGAAPGP